jgi:hypothetical protein
VAAIQAALSQERSALRNYVRGLALLAQDPTPEEAAEFAAVRAEFTARVRSLEAQLATAAAPLVHVPRLRALHERLTRTEVAALVDGFVAHGDGAGLRDLLTSLVESARITERRPQSHPVWLRAEVSWLPDVAQLLDAGLLFLAEPPQGPVVPTSAELRCARRRRYREAARARRLALRASDAPMAAGAGPSVSDRAGEGPPMQASAEPFPFGLYTVGDSTFTEEARRSDAGPLPADTRRQSPLPSQ